GLDERLYLWHFRDNSSPRVLAQAGSDSLAFAPDGRKLAAADSHNRLLILDTDSGATVGTLDDSSSVESVAFTPDSSAIPWSERKHINLVGTADGSLLNQFESESWITHMQLANDGQSMAATTVQRQPTQLSLFRWRLRDGLIQSAVAVDTGPLGYVSFTSDLSMLALVTTVGKEDVVELRRVDDGRLIYTLAVGGSVQDLKIAPDDEVLAVATRDGQIQLWRLNDGTRANVWQIADGYLWGLCFSPDSTMVAIAPENG